MGLSTFLGGIFNKIKINYLLPDVGSAVKLNGQWYKRFWSSQLKKKFKHPPQGQPHHDLTHVKIKINESV